MDKIQKWKYQCDANELVKILKDNYYNAYFCEDLEEAKKKVIDIIPEGSSVALGGSITLNQMNLITHFREGNYNFFDRYQEIPFNETVEIMRESMLADYLVTSTNAITRNGELVNMDSTGNRAAAMIFGPKKVIVIVGANKLVDNLDAAYKRIREVAILNAKRINHKVPCTITGLCSDCNVKDRICNYISIVNNGRKFEDRFTILVVADNVGY
ncbi:lactate utilization protein [Clostridium gasigenes]|uniref:Lactate utilization protein n=1 Tax=Clostridium gasigenes TaxID=94869 RepID=A0A7X0SFB9_9CLOT|nr:lactate utilization protein [Clostridium gasigenes]MBB6714491.1 lactate utilization protein [Clostridium gasigenes]